MSCGMCLASCPLPASPLVQAGASSLFHCCERLWLPLLGTRLFAVVFCRDEFPAVCSLLFNFLSDYYTNCFWCLLRLKPMNQNNGAGATGESRLCCSGAGLGWVSPVAASSGCRAPCLLHRAPGTLLHSENKRSPWRRGQKEA